MRGAISIQAQGVRLLEKHVIAPLAARLCFMAVSQERLFNNTLLQAMRFET